MPKLIAHGSIKGDWVNVEAVNDAGDWACANAIYSNRRVILDSDSFVGDNIGVRAFQHEGAVRRCAMRIAVNAQPVTVPKLSSNAHGLGE